VGTLGVTRYRTVIDYVKGVIKDSGKKAYTFLVGKPNVPKLANFAEVFQILLKLFNEECHGAES
jgi:diphthamide biosynthesis protein 2